MKNDDYLNTFNQTGFYVALATEYDWNWEVQNGIGETMSRNWNFDKCKGTQCNLSTS